MHDANNVASPILTMRSPAAARSRLVAAGLRPPAAVLRLPATDFEAVVAACLDFLAKGNSEKKPSVPRRDEPSAVSRQLSFRPNRGEAAVAAGLRPGRRRTETHETRRSGLRPGRQKPESARRAAVAADVRVGRRGPESARLDGVASATQSQTV